MDSYAISKVVNEETAKGFQRRSGIDIYGLRIGNVFEPDDYKMFKDFSNNPELRLPNLFNYIDARDLAQAVELCIEKNGLGYEVFNVCGIRSTKVTSINEAWSSGSSKWKNSGKRSQSL